MTVAVKRIIDQAQEFLHDDGAIWSRAELVNWLNDGYRQLLAQSRAVVRPFQIDVPGRTASTGTQEWEDRHGDGNFRFFPYHVKSMQISATFKWECQTVEGITPETSVDACTQLWELPYADSVDQHCRLVLSRQHDRPLKVYHNDKRLFGTTVKELDTLVTDWWTEQGSPMFWLPSGGGRDGTYEIYQIDAGYTQNYCLQESESGLPRLLSGDRTYSVDTQVDRWDYAYSGSADSGMAVGLGLRFTAQSSDGTTDATFSWELDEINDGTSSDTASELPVATQWWEREVVTNVVEFNLAVGALRSVSSADRQYLAAPYASSEFSTLGCARDLKSGDNAIAVWEVITNATQLDESDALSLIPARMSKYIKFYVLSRAFSRKGEGFRPDLAQHFTSLFQLGVSLLTKLANLSFVDRNYARQDVTPTVGYRVPLVQLPPQFERP